ncbi:MAG: transglycosylase domain-containing protein [Verrucomicrobiales bacterium]|nr:transglycosylase domain-containing protein [Verrucomicrobiales bacterium]
MAAGIGAGVLYLYAKPRYELAQSFDLEKIHDLEAASIIFDRNHIEIGRIFVQNRRPVSIDDVSENVVNALVATEDARFFEHGGVDYLGILRAAISNFRAGGVTQGASTVTQQLGRNAFEMRERSISRKVAEVFLAQRIEAKFSKREILELYLNRIYFGSGYYGIAAASNGYFGKEPINLTIPEAATIVGLIKSPNRLSPFNNPDKSRTTRNYVFQRMHAENMISKEKMVELQQLPLVTIPKSSAFAKSKYVHEQVRQRVIEVIGYKLASQGGFHIYTTIDNRLQLKAEAHLAKGLDAIEKHPGFEHQTLADYKILKSEFRNKQKTTEVKAVGEGEDGSLLKIQAKLPRPTYLQGAVLAIDNSDGGIVTLVGGRDFNDSMFDRAVLSRRKPGTAFMPFVYAAGFQSGRFPGTPVEDLPIDNRRVMIGGMSGILGEWGTESLTNVHVGSLPARRALALSKIAATVRFGISTGLSKVIALAEGAGISFEGDIKNFNASMLGRSPASMPEMCLAYSIFPNQGVRVERTHILSSIKDSKDKIIYSTNIRRLKKPLIDAYTAWQVTSCLTDALKDGTGRKAYQLYGLKKDMPLAGKTGTEYGYTDNWFIGYSSKITCAVWAGFDTPSPIYPEAFSSDTVLPIWSEVMNDAAEYFKPQAFAPPKGATQVELCRLSGERATDQCHDLVPGAPGQPPKSVRTTYIEYLRPGTVVHTSCTVHGGAVTPHLVKNGPQPFDPSFPFSSSPSLRAQVAHAEPIHPLSPILLGHDPYNSVIPSLKAVAVAVPKAVTEGDTSEGEQKTPLKAVPIAVPVEGLKAVPIVDPVIVNEVLEQTTAPVAKPVKKPRPRPAGIFPPPRNQNRVKINRPEPIRFNDR